MSDGHRHHGLTRRQAAESAAGMVVLELLCCPALWHADTALLGTKCNCGGDPPLRLAPEAFKVADGDQLVPRQAIEYRTVSAVAALMQSERAQGRTKLDGRWVGINHRESLGAFLDANNMHVTPDVTSRPRGRPAEGVTDPGVIHRLIADAEPRYTISELRTARQRSPELVALKALAQDLAFVNAAAFAKVVKKSPRTIRDWRSAGESAANSPGSGRDTLTTNEVYEELLQMHSRLGRILADVGWRPEFTQYPDPQRPVRCADGLSRPMNHCVQLENGNWIYADNVVSLRAA